MVDIIPKVTDADGVKLLVRRGAQLVDVLSREEYDRVHISGAISIPLVMISRHTADRLKWDKPVIVYSRDYECDISARAAWRLSSLGFTQVFRYSAGKADWMANGLPLEGAEAQVETAADIADLDVPTCKRGEKVGDVRQRVRQEGWDTCIVINDQLVVLGLLRPVDLEKADQSWPAEEAMERDPATFRLNASIDEIAGVMKAQRLDSILVTTPDGKLFGMVRTQDIKSR